jgi:hypothetical protein
MLKEKENEVPRLEVYLKHSLLVQEDGTKQEFKEGNPTEEAKKRLEKLRKAFESDFLVKIIEECKRPDVEIELLDSDAIELLTRLVDSVTSEVGRAIVGLTVLQLTIKAIAPEQSIRLHKGGGRGENFSWKDGIPMRVLDKYFNTPVLRRYDLLRLNADGVFMTRSLAENYPYSKLYKAALRGARSEWLEIVDLIETGKLAPLVGLKHLISMLFNRTETFKKMAEKTIETVRAAAKRVTTINDAVRFFKELVDSSTYSARVFEVAMHSLFQVLEDERAFEGYLKPLSQMRSANKKHGNIGDIEITARKGGLEIIEAWDAKYGKPYLRDELEELNEKLQDHPETRMAGFVVDGSPNLKKEIVEREQEIEQLHDIKIEIHGFEEWAHGQSELAKIEESKLAFKWIIAFAESLCQLRRDRAPIDEPSDVWVDELFKYAKKWL